MTVFMRPIPGLLALASVLAPSLATRHGPIRAMWCPKCSLAFLCGLSNCRTPGHQGNRSRRSRTSWCCKRGFIEINEGSRRCVLSPRTRTTQT
jgi:hypothetical protein